MEWHPREDGIDIVVLETLILQIVHLALIKSVPSSLPSYFLFVVHTG